MTSAPPPYAYLNSFTRDDLVAECLRLEHSSTMQRDEWRRMDAEIRRLMAERDELAELVSRAIAAALLELFGHGSKAGNTAREVHGRQEEAQ